MDENTRVYLTRIWRRGESAIDRNYANVTSMRTVGAHVALSALVVAAICMASGVRTLAQTEEVVVNQAAGRVIVAVVKNAILIGTVEHSIEQATRLPTPVQLSTLRAGVILGAVQWNSPSLQKDLARLDLELPHLRQSVGEEGPRLLSGAEGLEASDIEAIGKPLRERVNTLAGDLHSNLQWPETEPVLVVVVADYLQNYGPEVWQLSYAMDQQQQHGDYWVTSVRQPVYSQSWPPEKGQPHTLMEFAYPPENAPVPLLDLVRKKDPRIEALIRSDQKMADTANKFLSGESTKISAADATQFLRAALTAISAPDSQQSMAVIRENNGFDWILPPPAEPKPTVPQQDRPPDAPSLAHPPSERPADAPSLAHPH